MVVDDRLDDPSVKCSQDSAASRVVVLTTETRLLYPGSDLGRRSDVWWGLVGRHHPWARGPLSKSADRQVPHTVCDPYRGPLPEKKAFIVHQNFVHRQVIIISYIIIFNLFLNTYLMFFKFFVDEQSTR